MRLWFKRALPPVILAVIRDWRRAESGAKGRLLRHWLPGPRRPRGELPTGFSSGARILFVCHGNILRSALAEAILRQAIAAGRVAPTITPCSAGLHARAGKPADPRGVAAATALGIALEDHRAQPVTSALVDQSDLILVMDRVNAAELASRHPAAAPRIRLLAEFGPGDREIPDPYTGTAADVQATFERVHVAVEGLIERLATP